MFLDALRRRILSAARHSLGRTGLALAATLFLMSSLPSFHWHSHAGGQSVHEHSAFDGPEEHDSEPQDHHEHAQTGSDSADLHFHDGNHSMGAIGTMVPPPPSGISATDAPPPLVAQNPPASTYHAPYRPPIG